jgi:S-adenosyl-L-methionine hydrolase (adenosine-forming)
LRVVPILTLTTDFGTRDPFVAEIKAVILGVCPEATLVDVTHEVAPRDVLEGALALARAWRWFPPATVHLAVVDPGVGSARAAIACRSKGHFFVGPDNGLLSLAAERVLACHRIAYDERAASPTFHGRDVFAPAAARIAAGRPLRALGPAHRLARLPRPRVPRVLGADRFGNLLLSVRVSDVPKGSRAVQVEGLDAAPLRRSYSDVPRGSLLAYGGSGGLIEVAVRDGSAAARLGRPPRGVRVRFT